MAYNNIPKTIARGESVKWTVSFTDYPATLYALTYKFRCQNGPGLDVPAASAGSEYSVSLSARETAILSKPCRWQAWVAERANPENVFLIASGRVNIIDGFTNPPTAAVDLRSTAERIVEALEAAILGSASREQLEYEISTHAGVRRIRYMSRTEQVAFLRYYKQIVARERAAERIRNGERFGKTIVVNVRET